MKLEQKGILAGVARRMFELSQVRLKIDQEEEALWDEFHRIADDVAGAGETFKFIAHGLVPPQHLGRIHTTSPMSIDVVKLRPALTEAQWKLITRQERVFDLTLLEKAVAGGKVAREDVQAATKGGGAYTRKVPIGPATNAEIKAG